MYKQDDCEYTVHAASGHIVIGDDDKVPLIVLPCSSILRAIEYLSTITEVEHEASVTFGCGLKIVKWWEHPDCSFYLTLEGKDIYRFTRIQGKVLAEPLFLR